MIVVKTTRKPLPASTQVLFEYIKPQVRNHCFIKLFMNNYKEKKQISKSDEQNF